MATDAEQQAVRAALAGTPHPVILDLGAYRGEEWLWLQHLAPARYIAVEPDPRNAQVIREERGGVELVEAAVGSVTGEIDFFACDNDVHQAVASGSIHRPTGHLEHFPWCEFRRVLKVCVWTLDALCEAFRVSTIDLLWVDVQGAEADVIRGGQQALQRTRYLFIEAEDTEFYEGQILKPVLLAMLADFEVIQDFGYNVLLRNKCLT